MFTVHGTLKSSSPFIGYHVQAFFQEQLDLVPAGAASTSTGTTGTTTASTATWVASVRTADVAPSGSFSLSLPDADKVKEPVTLEVLTPPGQVLTSKAYSLNDLKNAIEIPVEPQPTFTVTASTDLTLGQNLKLAGRVLDKSGQRQASNLEVVLWGRPKAATGGAPQPPFEVVVITRTDASGYFSDDYPRGDFTDAYGVVGAGNGLTVPVPLEGSAFPKQVVLVVDIPPTAVADGCDCLGDVPRAPDPADLVNSPGTYSADLGGKCVQLTIPNRALEEFSFYSVVRTTEPEIKGLHLRQGRPVPDFVIKNLASLLGLQPQSGQLTARTFSSGAADTAATAAAAAGTPIAGTPIATAPAPGTTATAAPTTATAPTATGAPGTAPAPTGGTVGTVTGVASTAFHLDADTLRKQLILRDPESVNITQLAKAERLSTLTGITEALRILARPPIPGRGPMSAQNPAAWDEDSAFYQATTIAHGHLLHFKQVWRADGYSLGDLLYSLPLAPGQKKQVATIDYDRREVAARSEQLSAEERLSATISRDRDISEIVNSTLSQSSRGGSHADVSGGGGGIGAGFFGSGFGLLIGGGGGGGQASSTAWQNSSRDVAANSLQQLRDNTQQAASSMRGMRSTVVQTVQQGEAMTVQTESVANYNHCHALTIEYFEVLRHLQVSQEVADVQECLFIPLLMTPFDSAKALRWRNALRRYLRDPSLAGGFDALHRIATNYAGADFPAARFADEPIQDLEGELLISFHIPRPADDANDAFVPAHWSPLGFFLPLAAGVLFDAYLSQRLKAERDQVFATQIAPRIVEKFITQMQFAYIDAGGNATAVSLEPTLISNFVGGQQLYVTLRPTETVLPAQPRAKITDFRITTTSDLPVDSKAIIHRGSLRYRTAHMSNYLFADGWIETELRKTSPAVIATPTSREERRNPRDEDRGISQRLLNHLNENLEYYHKAIWWSMDPDRRHMLLDGFVAPNAGGRSVASVVENQLIGIVGNSLVMPVAPGFHLDPTYRQDIDHPVDLLHLYAPNTPVPPMRISIPTRGVFAEAVMGSCNSCETKDDSVFWRWEESPSGDLPTAIQPVSTASRASSDPNLTPKPFPAAMINMQTAPTAPDPTGLAAVLKLLTKPDLFKDITGLAANQANALQAMQLSLQTAKSLGGQAVDLAQQQKLSQNIDQTMGSIQKAQRTGLINQDQASSLTNSALQGLIGGGQPPAKSLTDVPEVKSLLNSVAGKPDTTVSLTQGAEAVDVGAVLADTTGTVALDPGVQAIWDANPTIQAAFGNDVNKFQADTRKDWDDHPDVHGHFKNGLSTFREMVPGYEKAGIHQLAQWIHDNIQDTTFFGKKVQIRKSLVTGLAAIETAIKAAATTPDAGITVLGGGFVPREIAGTAVLSHHGVGQAIDIDPTSNPKLALLVSGSAQRREALFLVIKAVTGKDVKALTDYDQQRTASTTFQSTFGDAWVTQQQTELTTRKTALAADPANAAKQQAVKDQQALVDAISLVRSALDGLKTLGFLNHQKVVVEKFQAAGWTWGGEWHEDKDYMHFETGAVAP